jgi:hypothetical protein
LITEYEKILRVLRDNGVDFIVIGGVAANLHGSARATFDLDLVYSRKRENLGRLILAISPFQPYLRGAPAGLPFKFDEQAVRNGLNFTLTTTLGDIDLLGEVAGGGNYDQLLPYTVVMEAFGGPCPCVTLERLIQLKRAAGRPKDLEPIAELQALFEERRKRGQASGHG